MTLIVVSLCFIAGCGVVWAIQSARLARCRRRAQAEADEIFAAANESAEILMTEAKERAEDYESQAQERFERDFSRREERIAEQEEKLKDLEARLKERVKSREDIFNKKKSLVDKFAELVGHKEQRFQKIRDEEKALLNSYLEKLSSRSDVPMAEIKAALCEEMVNEAQVKAGKLLQTLEEDINTDSEKLAKKIIGIALNRFARSYCDERGIGYVYLANEKVRQRVLGPERCNLAILEKACGVDLIYNEELTSVSVSGFDPVRRELARATLEKLCNEREVNEQRILHLVQKTKRDLFRTIRSDGQKIASELGLKGFHHEVIDMMGALRYRYSFAQNQYFHCGEVGYLCGLLSAELGLSVRDGRRAGLLHDIGKAMDHSLEGGHAVIGADFIQKHGEEAPIVHAVRAHHYDETPSTDLAYLVIAADALSGARPGARRSTADSYMQKMGQLELIGNSFDGVISTYILSAGREVRVHVDSARVDDQGALTLSKQIAKKIEEECSYPGLIKVTVVRETQAVEMAK